MRLQGKSTSIPGKARPLLASLFVILLVVGPARGLMAAEMTAAEVKEILANATVDAPADLSGRLLSGLDLSGVDFKGANLNGAVLKGANLAGADLSNTNLDLAIMRGANLAGARLSATIS